MTGNDIASMAETLDGVEADLVMLQHRLYGVRRRLERVLGRPVGYQYDAVSSGVSERDQLQALKALASAMRKLLPAELREEMLGYLDPLGTFKKFLQETP